MPAFTAKDIAEYFTSKRTALNINDENFKSSLESYIDQLVNESLAQARPFKTKSASFTIEQENGGLTISKKSVSGSDSICISAVNSTTIKII